MAYTCPVCGLVGHHPRDAAERYCARCHVFEDDARQAVQLRLITAARTARDMLRSEHGRLHLFSANQASEFIMAVTALDRLLAMLPGA